MDMKKQDIVIDNIVKRRSIRKYKDEIIDETLITQSIKSGMYAPSAVNKQPWHFIVFDGKETVEKIAAIHPNSQMIKNATKSILVCGDINIVHAPGYLPCDCSAATQNMLLTIHALGLGGVWIGIYPREARMEGMKEIFNLPENIVPFSIIAIGYPDENKELPNRFKPERIHTGKW